MIDSRRNGERAHASGRIDASRIGISRHIPSYIVWMGAKLSSAASRHFRNTFGVGIEVWRALVMLSSCGSVSAQEIGQTIDMDKGAVSRTLRAMQALGLVEMKAKAGVGRMRVVTLTDAGHDLFVRMEAVARERERLFLEALSESECEALRDMLSRLEEQLPKVEDGIIRFLARTKGEGDTGSRRRGGSRRGGRARSTPR